MKLEVLEYLKKYIQEKYPMYYDPENQIEFIKFINLIVSDKKFESEIKIKMVDKNIEEVLNSGDMDYIIDDLVNVYAKDRYFKIWDNLEDLSSRIKKAILKESNKDPKIEIISEDILDKISNEIALVIIKNEDIVDYSSYKNGTYDEKYVDDYNYYLIEYKKQILNHVENVIKKKMSFSKFKVTEDTYTLMVSNICSVIMRDFKYSDILNGSCDRQIIRALNFFRKKLVEEISTYVNGYIVNEVDDLMGVSIPDVINDILLATVVNGEISANKLLNGRLNSLINGCVSRKKKRMPDTRDAISHIDDLIIKYDSMGISNDELANMSSKIYEELHSNNIFDKDIVSLNYDDYIKTMIEAEMRVLFSVEQKGKPKETKANWLKRFLPKHIISLVLAGTIVVSAGRAIYAGIEYIGEKTTQIFNNIKNSKSLKSVDEFDGYKYSLVFTKYSDACDAMMKNVPEFYKKSLGYSNPEYAYLGFYRMYDNIMEDKLAIMDSMMYNLRGYSENNLELSDFHKDISRYNCYLDFVVDRLEAMGCDEINDDKYRQAIKVYKNAMFTTEEDETAMDILIANFSSHADVIKEIMSLYKEYSENCEVQFGNELIDINDNNKGRKI